MKAGDFDTVPVTANPTARSQSARWLSFPQAQSSEQDIDGGRCRSVGEPRRPNRLTNLPLNSLKLHGPRELLIQIFHRIA